MSSPVVALYTRISRDQTGREEGVGAQERYGRAYAADRWPGLPVEVFCDNDLTAADDDVTRPEFERLREWVRDGRVAQVWAKEQYRVERREAAWFIFAAELDAAGITELHTRTDGIVQVRSAVAGIKAVLGAEEVRRVKQRIRDTQDDQAARGLPSASAWRCYGYRAATLDDGTRTLAIVEAEAAVIRWCAEKVLLGWSMTGVAADLGERGVPTRNGAARWYPNVVKQILTNPTVAGRRVHRGEIVGDGNWPAILPGDVFDAVVANLSQPRVVKRRDGKDYPVPEATGPAGRKYVLTGGLSVCGKCRHRLVGAVTTSGRQRRRRAYLLCSPTVGGKGCVSIPMDAIDAYVLDRLWTKLDSPKFLAAVNADDASDRRAKIHADLQQIEADRRELAKEWSRPGALTMAEWRVARDELTTRERELQRELNDLPTVQTVDVEEARESWPWMVLDEKRAFVRMFIEKVTVYPVGRGVRAVDGSRVRIKWRRR